MKWIYTWLGVAPVPLPTVGADKRFNMQTSKHDSLLLYHLKLTRFGLFRWKRTADHNETFTASMKGRFVITVWEDKVRQYFRLEDPDGQILLVSSADSDVVKAIFSKVKSQAFNLYGATAQIGRLDS